MTTLDLTHPLRSLRDAAGLSGYEAARRRGVSHTAQLRSERRGDEVELSTLLRSAEAWGLRLAVRVWLSPGDEEVWRPLPADAGRLDVATLVRLAEAWVLLVSIEVEPATAAPKEDAR